MRVVYRARLPEAVFVLHAFPMKTPATPRADFELATRRYPSSALAAPLAIFLKPRPTARTPAPEVPAAAGRLVSNASVV